MLDRLYQVIEVADENDKLSKAYDVTMMIVIILSIIPLCFIKQNIVFKYIDITTVIVFIIDYFLRWITADCKNHTRKITTYLKYPFGFMAIIDLLSILPSLLPINTVFRVLKILRLLRTFRVFKFFRYSKNINMIRNVLLREKQQLLTVGILACAYIFISALIVFQVEPNTFGNMFRALYWATISLTTVGYGDIYPLSQIGQIISMVSSFLGIAVVALPAGIIVSGYSEELKNK